MLRIDRYILREFLGFFIMTLGVTIFLFVLGDFFKLSDFVMRSRFGVPTIFRICAYLLAMVSGLALPIAFFFACILTWNRLSGDSEYLVLRAAGLSLYRLLVPLSTIAVLIYGLACLALLYGRPWGAQGVRHLLFEAAYRQAHYHVQPGAFHDAFRGLTLYVKRVRPAARRLEEVFIASKDSEPSQVIVARTAELLTHTDTLQVILRLHHGAIHRYVPEETRYRVLRFERYDVQLEVNTSYARLAQKQPQPQELFPAQMQAEIRSRLEAGKTARDHLLVWYRSFAFPFISIVCAGLGPVLGIVHMRSARAGGYVLGLLSILGYYVMLTASNTLGEETSFSPLLSSWLPNICLGAITLWLLRRTARGMTIFAPQAAGRFAVLWPWRRRMSVG